MLTKITIKNAVYYGYHGVSEAEKELGGKYEVDLEFWYNAEDAITNDNVDFAVNYQNVLAVISDIIKNEQYNLIESLADNILNNILKSFEEIEIATIRIRKICVPVNQFVNYIEAEITHNRLTT